MLFPQFWFAPLANLFEEVLATAAGLEVAADEAVAELSETPTRLSTSLSLPRHKLEAPPGAWCSRVVERSVMVFPQFWLAPLAKLFEEVLATAAGTSDPRHKVETPPGAWCSRVVERPVIVFPQFWLAPHAN